MSVELTCQPTTTIIVADRRRRATGKLGRRQSDAWMPYNAAFVVQALGQNHQATAQSVAAPYKMMPASPHRSITEA